MPVAEPTDDGIVVVGQRALAGIAENALVNDLVQGIDDRLGAREIHVGRKDGDGVLVESLGQTHALDHFARVPLHAVGAAPLDVFVKIILHLALPF